MAEITRVLDLSNGTQGSRVLLRREEPYPGANYTFIGPTNCATRLSSPIAKIPTSPTGGPPPAPHAGGGSDQRRQGLRHGELPLPQLPGNQMGLFLVQLAQNLLFWAKRLCLPAGPTKRLRYQVVPVPGRMVLTGRRSILRLDSRWS
ncbi:MAG TPA: hypothetical protein VMW80_01365 [Candidatus Dormibacteraeota bacterium]|nr:hypothetical protein [Candidatus Dormibacteraeota bacterium]